MDSPPRQLLFHSQSMQLTTKAKPGLASAQARKTSSTGSKDQDQQPWLSAALQVLGRSGVDASLELLRRSRSQAGREQLSLSRKIVLLATAAASANPGAAMRLCEAVSQSEDASPEAWLMAGALQDRLGERAAAARSMLAVLQAKDSTALQRLRASNLLVRFGQQELALSEAKRAFEDLGKPLEHAATLLYIAQVTADWPLVKDLTKALEEGYRQGKVDQINESPRTHVLWCADESVNIQVLKRWSQRSLPAGHAVVASKAHGAEGKIRLGYLSSDFREHPTSRLVNGLLRHHDRSRFELFMYCSGWDDGSAMRKEVESHFDHVYSVASLGDRDAAELIASHGIDILVELNGPTRANRMGILAYRPALVQIDYLGWPGSVGGRVVDYVVGDHHTVPAGSEQAYPEKVIRLDPTYQVNDHRSFSLGPCPARGEVGLPADERLIVLGMFNAINKVHQEVWDTWMQILKRAPQTVLWLLDPGPMARRHIARAAVEAGVPLYRIKAAPRTVQEKHLERLQCCDLMLDPWPYGGHTSTADALFAGVPVVTLDGSNFAGRVSAGLLKAAGLGELAVKSKEDYVQTVLDLVQRPDVLRQLKTRLRSSVAQNAVFDAPARAHQLEKAFAVALDRARRELPAVHINVKPGSVAALLPSGWRRPAVDKPNYRVAVVTPYFRADQEKLERCCDSVARQTMRCDHILVADGEPQPMPADSPVIHMVLPSNVGNSGAAPRGFGAQYAFVQGYDAVAFLDADNWFDPDHVQNAVQLLERGPFDVVYARRRIVFPDSEVLPFEDPDDAAGRHVDTNCYVFSRRAAFLASAWAMYPKEFGAGEDRYLKAIVEKYSLRVGRLESPTVWYETNWSKHYSLANKQPVQPLRKPANWLGRAWDPGLAFSRTGIRF